MAGLGFKDFQVGEVLTSSDVDGYLMQQTTMRFADSGARGSALGTATGTAVPLAEGMLSYLDDTNGVEVYTGSAWIPVGMFSASTAIATTDASWSVPALANPIVRVTVIGGGGGGGGSGSGDGGSGSASTFGSGAPYAVTADGGEGGHGAQAAAGSGDAGEDGFSADNGGMSGTLFSGGVSYTGGYGQGGRVVVAYVDLTGVSTVNVVIGGGGSAGGGGATGGAGGDGVVIFEYRAA